MNTLKWLALICFVVCLFTAGCGDDGGNVNPQVKDGKEDPRIKRAGTAGADGGKPAPTPKTTTSEN
jgi:hypothetical protein